MIACCSKLFFSGCSHQFFRGVTGFWDVLFWWNITEKMDEWPSFTIILRPQRSKNKRPKGHVVANPHLPLRQNPSKNGHQNPSVHESKATKKSIHPLMSPPGLVELLGFQVFSLYSTEHGFRIPYFKKKPASFKCFELVIPLLCLGSTSIRDAFHRFCQNTRIFVILQGGPWALL